MFAYCGNNSVYRTDTSGFSWYSDFWNKMREMVEEKKEEASSREAGTTTIGLNISGAFGIAGALSIGLTYDAQGNAGIVDTECVGGGMPSWGVCIFETHTTAPNIDKQKGLSTQVGGSASFGATIGGEYVIFTDPDTYEAYHGITVMAGVGAAIIPAEFHGEVGYSSIRYKTNIYDIALYILDFIAPEN